MPVLSLNPLLDRLFATLTGTSNPDTPFQWKPWINGWRPGLFRFRALSLSGLGLWNAPLMVSARLVSLYLSRLMHEEEECGITEAHTLAQYAQNGFFSLETICSEDEGAIIAKVGQRGECRHVNSTRKEATFEIDDQIIKDGDTESQCIQLENSRANVVKNFCRGTVNMSFNLTALVILGLSIKASLQYLSSSPVSLLIKCLLWYTYGIICSSTSASAGRWLKLFWNLRGKRWIEKVPIRANTASKCIEHLLEGISNVVEAITTGIFVAFGVVVVPMWWVVWQTWKLTASVW